MAAAPSCSITRLGEDAAERLGQVGDLGLGRARDRGEHRARAPPRPTAAAAGAVAGRASQRHGPRDVGPGPQRDGDRAPGQHAPQVRPVEDRQAVQLATSRSRSSPSVSDSSGPTVGTLARSTMTSDVRVVGQSRRGTPRSWRGPDDADELVGRGAPAAPDPACRRRTCWRRTCRASAAGEIVVELRFHRLVDADAGDEPVEDDPAIDGSRGRRQEPADQPEHDPVERLAEEDHREPDRDEQPADPAPDGRREPRAPPRVAGPAPSRSPARRDRRRAGRPARG